MPSVCYQRVADIRLAPIAHLWAAFSPLSGETSLINDETAAMLEVLEAGPADTTAVSLALAADCDLAPSELCELIEAGWPRLLEAGLVRRLPSSPH